jgi:hypothetical protein
MIRRACRCAMAGLVLAMAPALGAGVADAPRGGDYREFSDICPGAGEPHCRIVLWHVTKAEGGRVAR